MQVDVRDVGREYPLKEGMATHSSILAGRISWTEEPGGLQSIELHRVRHNGSNLAYMVLFLRLDQGDGLGEEDHRARSYPSPLQQGSLLSTPKITVSDYGISPVCLKPVAFGGLPGI